VRPKEALAAAPAVFAQDDVAAPPDIGKTVG
jgi:hypothetical protein